MPSPSSSFADSEFHRRQFKSERGFILITVLLFLAILNLLIISSMQVAWSEMRMSCNFKDRMLAFYQAQNNLYSLEQNLRLGKIDSNMQQIPSDICGVRFYRVITQGQIGKAKSVQQSTYVVPIVGQHCEEKAKIMLGRQSWREI